MNMIWTACKAISSKTIVAEARIPMTLNIFMFFSTSPIVNKQICFRFEISIVLTISMWGAIAQTIQTRIIIIFVFILVAMTPAVIIIIVILIIVVLVVVVTGSVVIAVSVVMVVSMTVGVIPLW